MVCRLWDMYDRCMAGATSRCGRSYSSAMRGLWFDRVASLRCIVPRCIIYGDSSSSCKIKHVRITLAE